MQEFDEKRDYNRMDIECDIAYRLAGAETVLHGHCTSISGAGVSFVAEQAIEVGKALEIKVTPSNKSISPPLIAFTEAVRCSRQADGRYAIAAAIKGIKAN